MKRIIALMLTVLLLTGCTQSAPYTPTGDALDEQSPTAATSGTQAAQSLSLAYDPDKGLNPYTCADFTNRALFSLLYQSLFSVDADYNVEPQLCRSYSVSADNKTYIFYLEKATFSDGTTLTVTDVVASLEAARSGSVYSGRFTQVEEISVTADGGVRIDLAIAYENFPLLLDIPIVKAAQVNADFPLGTGPYIYQSSGLTLRQDWWCSASLPISAQRIPLVTATTAKEIRDAFELLDVGVVCANPANDSYVDFRSDYDLWDCESGTFLYLACRAKSSVFSNEAVRQALTHAIDRTGLVRDYYRTFGLAATLPASPNSPYYNKNLAAQYDYDPDLFRAALESEGMTGKSIVLLVNKDDGRRTKVAYAIAEMLEDCGLTVTVRAYSGTDYTNALKNGNYDLHLGQTVLSPNMDLSAFYASDGALNYGGLASTAMLRLCRNALADSDNYDALHQAVMEDGKLCPIAFLTYAVYVQPDLVENFAPARDNIFYYSLGKTMAQALISS